MSLSTMFWSFFELLLCEATVFQLLNREFTHSIKLIVFITRYEEVVEHKQSTLTNSLARVNELICSC